MISLTTGQDLAKVFLPIIPSLTINVPDGNFYYTYTTTDGYTVYVFANWTSTPNPSLATTNIGYNTVSGIHVTCNNFATNNTLYVTLVVRGKVQAYTIRPALLIQMVIRE